MAARLTPRVALPRTTGLLLSPEAAGRGEGQPLRPDAGGQQQLHPSEDRSQAPGRTGLGRTTGFETIVLLRPVVKVTALDFVVA